MKHLYLKILLSTLITISGVNFLQAQQYIETFESFSNGSTSFTSDGQSFSLTGGFHVAFLLGLGASNSNFFVDNSGNESLGDIVSIQTSNTATFTMKDVDIYLSEDSGNNPGGSGSVIIRGRLDGSTVFTVTRSTGINDNLGVDNGFFNVNFATEGGVDNSLTVIDELQFELTGSFDYIAIDEFTYDIEEVVVDTSPPFALSIDLNGTPPTTADEVNFTVTFDEDASNVTLDDFTLDAVGTTGNLSNITGLGTTYVVTVNNISGEGTISIDLNSSTDIEDTLGNTGTPAFTAGENHTVSACYEEDFESFTDGASTFTSNGLSFNSTNGLVVENVDDAGASESDRYLDNNGNGPGTYAIQTTGGELFTVSSVDLYLSSIVAGTTPTNDGTITINGKSSGVDVFTITKTSGFPNDLSSDNGFFNVNFATDGASDYSTTNIDELEIVIASSFVYLAVDHLDFCEEGTIDTFPPIVQSIEVSGNPTTLDTSVDFIVTFNENVNNVTTDDFSLDLNGTTGNIASVTGANNVYTVTVNNIDGDGTISIDLNSSTDIEDALGNSGVAGFTAGETHIVSDCFSEDFESFSDGATTFTSNGKAFTTTNGLEVNLLNGGGTNDTDQFLENNGAGAGSYSIQTTDNSLINVNSLFLFVSSDVTGTVPTDDGTVAIRGMLDGSMVYTIDLNSGNITFPTDVAQGNNGFFEVDFVAHGASDVSAMNVDEIQIEILSDFVYLAIDSFEFCLDIDTTPPGVTISSAESSPTNASSIPLTITFDEAVSGFGAGDIIVGNGSLTAFSGSGSVYNIDVTPGADDPVTVDVNAGVAMDAAGNTNTAATQFSIIYDGTSPGVTIASSESSPTNTSPISMTITFDEPVSGFVIGDLTVDNGSASNFVAVDGSIYTADITPSGVGDITVDIAAGVAQDASGNDNTAASQMLITFDNITPTANIQDEPPVVNSTAAFGVTLQFSEDVTGFVIGDITVGNGSVSNFVAVDGNTYTADITPNGAGDVTIDIAAGIAQDTAGNNNTAATQAVIIFDNIAPAASITAAPSIVNNVNPYNVTVDFGEIVTGFVSGDIVISNGSVTDFTDNGDGTFTVEITPDGNGDITVDVAANVAQDAAGNSNTAASTATTIYNATAPTVDIQGEPSIVNSTAAFGVTIQFSEDVTGFVIGDITVSNGSVSNFVAVDGNTYTAEIIPNGAGDVTIDIAAGAVQNVAGNNNIAALQAIIIFDNLSPTVSITSTESSPTINDPIPVTIIFDEAVTGFVISDITVSNGTLSNFSGSGTTYTVDVTPTANGTVTVDVNAGVAIDAAGNTNTAAMQFSIVYDSTIPMEPLAVQSVLLQGNPALNATSVTYIVTFNRNMNNITRDDFAVVGTGSVSIMSTSVSSNTGTSVNVTIEGIMGQGSLKLDLLEGTDITDNTSTNPIPAFTSGEVHIVDRIAPRVYITSPEFSYTYLNPIPVSITFNDEVTGFTVNDISVHNGTLTNFAGSGDSYRVDVIPESDGLVALDINTGAAVNAAGNTNIPALQFSIIYKTIPPVGTVYPNPFREKLNITSESGSSILKVQIFDFKGKMIYSEFIDQQGIVKEIELPHLQDGMYLMKLDYGNKKILKKIIKQ